jgi:hypothetical protein
MFCAKSKFFGGRLTSRLRQEEWANLFRRHNLKIVSWDTWRLFLLDPCKHVVVKLQRNGEGNMESCSL